jgi:hypothetical protein
MRNARYSMALASGVDAPAAPWNPDPQRHAHPVRPMAGVSVVTLSRRIHSRAYSWGSPICLRHHANHHLPD